MKKRGAYEVLAALVSRLEETRTQAQKTRRGRVSDVTYCDASAQLRVLDRTLPSLKKALDLLEKENKNEK